MLRKLLSCSVLILSAVHLYAQIGHILHINPRLNVGASQMYPDVRFEKSFLEVYKFVKIPFDNRGIPYSFEDFEKDYKLRNTFIQPRYGMDVMLTAFDWPFFILAETMSSTSSYQKMSLNVTGGIGMNFPVLDSAMCLSAHLGYKMVLIDRGFGSKTMVNSIGSDEGRDLAGTFLGARQPLGRPTGNMLSLRVGASKFLGYSRRVSVGLEMYGDLDLTDELVREARMTNVGMQLYVRYHLLGGHDERSLLHSAPQLIPGPVRGL
jgi:hypothetical protein